ncbi:hypothetical protein TVAG_090790 [Trichomonas vaginalis G3]|uniref:Uncharacterized protein n=1 Tax=Trichomonas vaginalis (strain ATCC PRA-98 / G3) TaxID=412133 RepID=A2F916_TRIV3|nr:hypothetical protein TVAGG3_0827960 [Trichomonas vaginalis G3]EAX98591.1 hypothetical protein TVAG_090790 [Trichomonas vaginalis G3]KAI5498380.1 hypothetical protein TVAGG3_0827960 [Trichomonas vaginalis G3]|eukprot:XP_001311521.1 hypothetical protein [Trichomonas vaginalis G3]
MIVEKVSIYQLLDNDDPVEIQSNNNSMLEDSIKQLILQNINPKNVDFATEKIFTFIIDQTYYHFYHFIQNNLYYALLIITKLDLTKLFYDFFLSVDRDMCEKLKGLPIKSIFTYINSLISFWSYYDEKTMHIIYSDKEFDQNIEFSSANTFYFDPITTIPAETDYKELWSNILSEVPVYVECEDPYLLSKAVNCLQFFTLPRKYKGKLTIRYNTDESNLGKDQDANIIGLTQISNYENKYVLKIKKSAPSSYEMLKWVDCNKKMNELIDKIILINLIKNPFYELLGGNPLNENFDEFVSEESALLLPSYKVLKKF